MRIIESTNRRAMARVLARDTATDRALERRVAAIVDRVRRDGDTALVRFARRFDGASPPLEITVAEMRAGAARVAPDVRRAIRQAARHIARVAARQIPKHFDVETVPGVLVEQRVEPLASAGCYVPGGRFPLPSSLLMTAVPARVAGVRDVIVVCPRPEPAVMAAALEAGVTRMFRMGGAHAIAALAYGTATVPKVDKIVGPGNRYVAAAKALVSGNCAIDFYAGPTEIVIVAGSGRPDWIAADLIAQAEHDPDARSVFITWNRGLARRVQAVVTKTAAGRDVVKRSIEGHGAIILTRGADEAMALANRMAPEHLVVDDEALTKRPLTAGAVFVGPFTAQAAGDYATGSNHVLPTSGAARFRGGLSASDFVRVMSVQRVTKAGLARLAPTILPLARAEGLRAHAESIEIRLQASGSGLQASGFRLRASGYGLRASGYGLRAAGGPQREVRVMSPYQKPAELYDGLRLHQNENTGGCSPKVLQALASLRADQVCFYPPYEAATAACARYLGVDPDRLTLLNGLDEGIMALAVAYLRPAADGLVPEAIIPEPAFEIFRFDTEVVGGRSVRVMPVPDFSFRLDAVLEAITPRTRVVFLTNPNNPTGVGMPRDAIRALARRVPPEAVVFVDEAYGEFSGETFIPDLKDFPNVIVGRTFSKAFGLAGLRIGAVTGAPRTLEPLRLAVPVYSVNIAAVVAVQAALEDLDFLRDYLRQVGESKALVYAACDRLRLSYVKSSANFVLIRAGERLEALVQGAAARGIYVRDRSTEPGCEGCLRVAAGVVAHTRRFVAVMEEVLCAAR